MGEVYKMVVVASQQHKDFIVNSQLKMAKESEGLELQLDVVVKGVEYILNNSQVGFYLVFESNNKALSCLLILKEWSDWRAGNVLWIHSVYVAKEARRSGIFSKMYDFLKQKVSNDPELKGLRLYVDKTNEKAVKTYEKLGMSREHYHMYEWLK